MQLEIVDLAQPEGQFFRVRARNNHSSTLIVERDFERVVVSDQQDRLPERTYRLVEDGTEHLANFNLQPIPTYPRALLHHESLEYVCFTFERIGAFPKAASAAPAALGTVGIRGFQGSPGNWREFEVGSTKITGRGLGNLSIESELGGFFIPGPGSCGDPYLSLRNGGGLTLQDFDLEELENPTSRWFDLKAHNALRSLGFPTPWPPPKMLL